MNVTKKGVRNTDERFHNSITTFSFFKNNVKIFELLHMKIKFFVCDGFECGSLCITLLLLGGSRSIVFLLYTRLLHQLAH